MLLSHCKADETIGVPRPGVSEGVVVAVVVALHPSMSFFGEQSFHVMEVFNRSSRKTGSDWTRRGGEGGGGGVVVVMVDDDDNDDDGIGDWLDPRTRHAGNQGQKKKANKQKATGKAARQAGQARQASIDPTLASSHIL